MEAETVAVRLEGGPGEGTYTPTVGVGGWCWPPPEEIRIPEGRYRLVSHSLIPDDVKAQVTHLLRGAVYEWNDAA